MTGPGDKRETTKAREGKEDSDRESTANVQTSRVLQIKRWEVREGPFRGFNSPPGRF